MQGLADEGLHVEFYLGSIQDDRATEAAGIPVFKDVPFVRIAIPGNRDEIIDTVAWLDEGKDASHINRFPRAWAAFKNGQQAEGSGFPLKEWAQITRSAVDTLAHFKIKTVEQLANVSDGNLEHLPLPNPVELRQRAKNFLASINSGESLRSELETLKAQLAAMQAPAAKVTVIPAAAEVQVLGPVPTEAPQVEAVAPKRRGRPKKSEQTQAGA